MPNQHIVLNNGKWQVKRENAARATKNFDTQKDAISYARNIAMNQQSELVIQSRNGKICDKDSYGNDPYHLEILNFNFSATELNFSRCFTIMSNHVLISNFYFYNISLLSGTLCNLITDLFTIYLLNLIPYFYLPAKTKALRMSFSPIYRAS